jgi:hypothetical protein
MKHSNLRFFCLNCIVLIFLSSSCEKSKQQPIPNVYVSFNINILTDPQFLMLQAQGNSMIINFSDLGLTTLGYDNNGIIIYNSGADEFVAYDCTCPYDYPSSIKVKTDGGSIATCPKCKSIYFLQSYGMPSSDGPSNYSLKDYRTSYNPNTGTLYVHN